MVKSLYTDPIDLTGTARNYCEFRVQWFFCVSMYSIVMMRTTLTKAMVILSFIGDMSPSLTNVDSLKNDMPSFVV